MSGKRPLQKLIIIMLVVVAAGILIARSYYSQVNTSVDPRIAGARTLYGNYNDVALSGDYFRVFALLDSIEAIYRSTPHYAGSFELGVVENNRAAALLTLSLYGDSIPAMNNPFSDLDSDSLSVLARVHIEKALDIYAGWNEPYVDLTEEELRHSLLSDFPENGFQDAGIRKKAINARAREIAEAIGENDRRRSVCMSNLGLVYRQQGRYEEAIQAYEEALKLWDRNLEAENNLNRILGRPLKKRNLIQKLFPPPREHSE